MRAKEARQIAATWFWHYVERIPEWAWSHLIAFLAGMVLALVISLISVLGTQ